MKVFFDTSVLVAASVDQLAQHEAALECFSAHSSSKHQGFCSSHALAETYATLTALPVKRRIQPAEALRLIRENLVDRLTVVELARDAYLAALERASSLGLISGVVYDALHLHAAEQAGCARLYTYNASDFRRLGPNRIVIAVP